MRLRGAFRIAAVTATGGCPYQKAPDATPSMETLMTSKHFTRFAGALLAFLSASSATAEGADASARPLVQEIDLALAAPSGGVIAVSYTPAFRLFERVNAGIGARATAFFGGDGVRFPTGDAARIAAGAKDVLTVDGPRSFAANLFISASLRVWLGLEIGANIDLIGFGFGPSVTGAYAGAAASGPQSASPSHLGLLLFGKHDFGQLDSEFFLAYWLGPWGVRAGLSHMSTEYTTDRPLDGGNDRFRASATRFFGSFGHRF